jgi:Protein of unknown function (DUF1559)
MSKIVAWTIFLTTVSAPALADEKKVDAEAHAKAVAPFLDEQTIAVGHVDLTRVDVNAIAEKLSEYGKLAGDEIDGPKKKVSDWLGAWTKAGVRELYVVVSLADVPGLPPLVVIPLEEGADAKSIGETLGRTKPFREYKFEKVGSALVGGAEKTLSRLKGLKPDNRPELAKGFAAAGDMAVQVVLVPTNENRRVAEEIMPKLPQELGGGPITIVTKGVQWAAFGADVSPQMSLRGTIQSQDGETAKNLRDLIARFYQLLGEEGPKDRKARDLFPGFDKLAEQLTPKAEGDRLVISLEEKDVAATLKPIVARTRDRAENENSANNLKQIGLAIHSYHDTYKHFPTVANFDKAGKPLLSWRVHLLPFLDQVKLYKEFHLDEPWDSEHNKKLIEKMPGVYRSSKNKELAKAGKTTYLAPVGEHMMFTGTEKTITFRHVTDGTSNTILIVDADDEHAVIWTKPEDLKIDLKDPKAGLRNDAGTFRALFADGSVHRLPANIDAKTLSAVFTRDGGEVFNLP